MHYQNNDTTSDTLCSNQDLMTKHQYCYCSFCSCSCCCCSCCYCQV